MNPGHSMVDTAFVQAADETEFQLIRKAQEAANSGNWIVGECACRWLHTYAKGRTDEAFGELIGLSKVQVFQRRRVWEEFGEIYSAMLNLTWTHFREALQWDDAEDCLRWANDCEATVAEMRAWRRAQRGEDLFADTTDKSDESQESEPGGNSGFRKNTEETQKPNAPSPVKGTTRAASSAASGKAERAKSSGNKGNPESPSRPVTEFHEDEDEEPDPIDEWLAARTLEDVVRAWFEYPDDLQPAAQHLRKLADRLDPPN